MKNQKSKSIIYVNFAPYDNAGKILDFLKDQFVLIIHFSFDFHKLNNESQSNILRVYSKGILVEEKKLFKLPTPESLLFLTLPFIALLINIQTIFYIVMFRKKYKIFDFYLSVNAFTAWIGNILRSFKVVEKTIFWVWDYYPPKYPDFRIRLARWTYWKFDKLSTKSSSYVIFLNKRLEELRRSIHVLPDKKKYRIVCIGTNPCKPMTTEDNILGHLGVLKKSQGLDLLFNNIETLTLKIPDLKIQVIGSGPDELYFRKRAKKYTNVSFLGFIKDDNKVDQIIRSWSLGIATYIPSESNESYWTDPSKIKAYISQSVPVITTNITSFSEEIKKSKAGIVIDYFDPQAFIYGVIDIITNKKKYKKNAYNLAQKYYFRIIYKYLFTH